MRVIGLDPGVHGAVAILDGNEIIFVADLPTKKQGKGGVASSQMICPHKLADMLRPFAVPGTSVAIEVAIVKPPMKLVSARTVGMNYGIVLAVLAGLEFGVVEMAPHDWKKRMSLGDDKTASVSMATTLFPRAREQLARHDRAEAALIARAGLLELTGR